MCNLAPSDAQIWERMVIGAALLGQSPEEHGSRLGLAAPTLIAATRTEYRFLQAVTPR
jgi:hypothetical protein